MAQFIRAEEAVQLVKERDFVMVGGSGGGHGVPEAVITALAERYREEGAPRGLTLASVVSLGDWEHAGFGRLAIPGLAATVITAGLNNCPDMAILAEQEQVAVYTLPQGVLSQLCRDSAAGRPGLLTRTGLGTFVDPRLQGGGQNSSAKADLSEVVTLGGEEYLFYHPLPIDVAIIRGTTSDEYGNITTEEEAYSGENLSIAMAARRRGGTVICQVKRVAAGGTLPGRQVAVPGALVDYVVQDPEQWQTYQKKLDPAYAGIIKRPASEIAPLPFDIRKVIARRGALELMPGDIVNLGFGVSNGIATVAVEEGFLRDLTLTVEQGIFGGAPAVGKDAGAGVNYDAMLDQPYQFDFYDGGGLDIAFLSFAEVDKHGNVNVSNYGGKVTGPGGFINITQGTRRVVFSGTLTTGKLDAVPDGTGGLQIRNEGRVKKWVSHVNQVTFSGEYARARGQEVTFITERAVFQLEHDSIVLTEIAKGVDVQADVLNQIGFPVRVAEPLQIMDERLFRSGSMGFLAEFKRRNKRERRLV